MEQRQAPRVLGHEDERRRVHGVGDPEAASEPLGELGLAGPELAHAGRRGRRRWPRQPAAAASDRVSSASRVATTRSVVGTGGHRSEGSRSRLGRRRWTPAGVRQAARGRPSGSVTVGSSPSRPRQPPPAGRCRRIAGGQRGRRSGPRRPRGAPTGLAPSRRPGPAAPIPVGEHERRRIDQQARPRGPRAGPAGPPPASGSDSGRHLSRASTPNGGAACSDARWRRSDAWKSRSSLPGRVATTMPADAHRAGAGERFGVDPGPDDEDAPGTADIDAARDAAPRTGRWRARAGPARRRRRRAHRGARGPVARTRISTPGCDRRRRSPSSGAASVSRCSP